MKKIPNWILKFVLGIPVFAHAYSYSLSNPVICFYSAFLSKPEWITFQFVFVLVRQQVKIRVNFFLQRKKNYPYHKNSHRYQQTSTNSNGKKMQRKKKNRFKNMHFTIKVGRWQCWQTMHQFNYSVGPDIDDRLLMVLTKSIRINAVSAGIFTFSLLFS